MGSSGYGSAMATNLHSGSQGCRPGCAAGSGGGGGQGTLHIVWLRSTDNRPFQFMPCRHTRAHPRTGRDTGGQAMIGGRIVQINDMGEEIYRLTCVGSNRHERRNMICVDVKKPARLPEIGTICWWQAGKVFCENDTLVLEKHGYSHSFGHWPTRTDRDRRG